MLNVNSNYGNDMEIQSKSPEKEKMDTGSKIVGVGGTNTLLKQVLTEIQKQTIILESIDRKLSTHK